MAAGRAAGRGAVRRAVWERRDIGRSRLTCAAMAKANGRPNCDYLLDAYARDVEALIDQLDGPVVLVGASRGG
ncbi:MAG TPA: hypothetical protein VJR88_12995 [Novosphingobium sp.]|nr:hypothetical protein [Novosphingobium sp.]HKR93181.1 hypothetical protein [Novosphingobium sp.]